MTRDLTITGDALTIAAVGDGVDVLVGFDPAATSLGPAGPPMTLALHVPATARDAFGYPPALIRQFLPTPGYTRHALGVHEAARDTRRARRRPRRIGAA